ncbi:response regulator [uncultured Polaribacter sp.]|uniref:DNA-binding response regulator n=1 Tax=uncultured Polaribacter sp. TaxID=174711 RepID=UPI00262BD2A8|nr:response regulator [uncultured Polaribacter sp.]
MFKKVLISDDLGSINKGVLTVLKGLEINNVQQVQYCDDAYLKIKKAVLDDAPYDLLITDLSFIKDHREQKYTSGESLIIALKKEYPALHIIVYSVEDRLQKVRFLMNTHHTNGYVCKGRRGLLELEKAIHAVYHNRTYLSPHVQQALNPKSDLEIDDYDIELVHLLSQGLSQEDISNSLKKRNITPSSLSSIEKKLNKLRIQFKANNAIHLVAIVKDLGLI